MWFSCLLHRREGWVVAVSDELAIVSCQLTHRAVQLLQLRPLFNVRPCAVCRWWLRLSRKVASAQWVAGAAIDEASCRPWQVITDTHNQRPSKCWQTIWCPMCKQSCAPYKHPTLQAHRQRCGRFVFPSERLPCSDMQLQMSMTRLPVKILKDVLRQSEEAMRCAIADVESDIIAMSGNHLRTIHLRSDVSWNMQLSGHPTLRELERLLARCFELFHGKDKVYPDAALPCVVPDTKETKLDLLLVQSRTAPASLQIFIAAEARKQDELPCTMPVFVLEELVLPCEPHPLDEVELVQLPTMLPRSCQGQLTVLKRFTELCCVDGEWERRRWRSLVFRTPGIRGLRRPFLIVFDEVIVRLLSGNRSCTTICTLTLKSMSFLFGNWNIFLIFLG